MVMVSIFSGAVQRVRLQQLCFVLGLFALGCNSTPRGDDNLGERKEAVTLPTGLARHRVAGARVHDGELQVRFTDPMTETDAEEAT